MKSNKDIIKGIKKNIKKIVNNKEYSKIDKLREIAKSFYGEYKGKTGKIKISRNPDKFGYLEIRGVVDGKKIDYINVHPQKALNAIENI